MQCNQAPEQREIDRDVWWKMRVNETAPGCLNPHRRAPSYELGAAGWG